MPVGFIPGRSYKRAHPGARARPRRRRGRGAAGRCRAEGRRRRISLGRANGRRFATSSGLGLDAALVRRWDGSAAGVTATSGATSPSPPRPPRCCCACAARWRRRSRSTAPARPRSCSRRTPTPTATREPMPLHVAPGVTLESGIELVAVGELTPRMIPGLVRLLVFGNRAAAAREPDPSARPERGRGALQRAAALPRRRRRSRRRDPGALRVRAGGTRGHRLTPAAHRFSGPSRAGGALLAPAAVSALVDRRASGRAQLGRRSPRKGRTTRLPSRRRTSTLRGQPAPTQRSSTTTGRPRSR